MQCSFDVDMWIRFSAFRELVYVRTVLAVMRQHADQKSRTLRLDYKEIEGNARRYGFYPLAFRKLLKSFMGNSRPSKGRTYYFKESNGSVD